MLLLVCFNNILAQDNDAAIKSKLDTLNEKIENHFLKKDAASLTKYYDTELTYYPEYKLAIFSLDSLKQFFNDWFSEVDIKTFKKKIYKAESFPGFILEIGAFQMLYAISHTSMSSAYNGKYMIIWKKTGNNQLTILSEAFSADKYIDPDAVPYSKVKVTETNIMPDHKKLDKALLAEIEVQNGDVISAVARGDGNDRAKGFVNDGIYMPHFDTILDGINNIRPYMLKTYSPEAQFRVKHNFYRVFDFGKMVLINGHFDGGWGNEKDGGVFTGNMSSLLRRENGKLLMYCQLPNNDKMIVSYKN